MTRSIIRNRRGVGTIIGAAFFLLILMTAFLYLRLQVEAVDDYNEIVEEMSEVDRRKGRENTKFIGVSATNENKLNITVENVGSNQMHFIWLGIFDETVTPNTQEFHKLDVDVEPAEIVSIIPEEIIFSEGQERVIHLVTEAGSKFSYRYPPIADEYGAQASVIVKATRRTNYNVSQWNLLGSTQNVSGAVTDLVSNDGNYVVFGSYYSGSSTDINDFVDQTCDSQLPSAKGTHSDFLAEQTGPDSTYDKLVEVSASSDNNVDSEIVTNGSTTGIADALIVDSLTENMTETAVGGSPDFKVVRGTTIISSGQSTATIYEGTNYTSESGVTINDAFIRIVNTRSTGMGRTAGGGSQNSADFSARIDNPENLLTSITFSRSSTTDDCRITWEIIQYTGPSGGTNEIIVRDVGDIATSGTTDTVDGSTITTISDKNKCCVFITGQASNHDNRGDWWEHLFTADLIASGPDWIPRFTRGKSGNSIGYVSYAVVEFTGSNWRDVQRVEFNDTGATWSTSNTEDNWTYPIPNALLNSSKAFLHVQYRTDNDATGLDDAGDCVELTSSNTELTVRNRATAGTRTKVVWIIENTQTGLGQMSVQHLSFYEGTGGSEEKDIDKTISEVSSMDTTSIMGEVCSSDGAGTAYPRGSVDVRLTSTTNVRFTWSDSGQEHRVACSIVQWPTAHYKLYVEHVVSSIVSYQNYNLTIRAYSPIEGFHLQMFNFTSSQWVNMSTIDTPSLVWCNTTFPKDHFINDTKHARIRYWQGDDTTKETLYVDYSGIYGWNATNYELDLEVQWTNTDYDEANEYLCIYAGTLSSENLHIDVWNGTTWITVVPALQADQWNNVSVSNYLTSSTLTIRFKGSIETDDTTHDSWEIDTAILHLWTDADEYTAEVEFIGQSNLEDWINLTWQIDSCWDIGEVTVTMQLFDYTVDGYPSSGNGYISYISDINPNTDELKWKSIMSNTVDFRNPSNGEWKVKIKGVKSAGTQFLMKVDWIDNNVTYEFSGNSIPYDTWQEYTIKALTPDGGPIPYGDISIYANGTNLSFRNTTSKAPLSNPCMAHLDADGRFRLDIKSANGSQETFTLNAVVGSIVGKRTVTQEVPS